MKGNEKERLSEGMKKLDSIHSTSNETRRGEQETNGATFFWVFFFSLPCLVEDEPAHLPLAAVGRALVEEAGDGGIVTGALGQDQQLRLVDADRPLHLRTEHGGSCGIERRSCQVAAATRSSPSLWDPIEIH